MAVVRCDKPAPWNDLSAGEATGEEPRTSFSGKNKNINASSSVAAVLNLQWSQIAQDWNLTHLLWKKRSFNLELDCLLALREPKKHMLPLELRMKTKLS